MRTRWFLLGAAVGAVGMLFGVVWSIAGDPEQEDDDLDL